MDDFEYCAQWYHPHGVDSWIKTGWHGDNWTTKEKANQELQKLMESNHDEVRTIRRRKAGPIEVWSEYP